MTDAPNPTLDAAVDYAARGWPVIPLKYRSKKPATQHGKLDASADPERIAEWFQSGGTLNVGILTGIRSGIIVVDIDPRNDGVAGLVQLERKYGKLPDTLRAATGGGGTHHIFQSPPGTGALHDRPNVAGFRGVDVKADGYIVAAPSIHPDTAQPYTWENSTPIAIAPGWLIDLARRDNRAQIKRSATGSSVPEGGRNDSLFRKACGMRARGYLEEAIRVAITAENILHCDPPMVPEEVEQIVQSAMRYDAGSSHPATELGNARRLVELMDGNARYEPNSRVWYVWDDSRWARDHDGHVVRFAKRVVDDLLSAARSINDPDVAKGRITFAHRSQAHARITGMIELAKTEPGVAVKFENFDRRPHILNCRNGMVDLRSGTLMPHDREALITQIVDVEYQPTAACSTFERFMTDILSGDEEVIEYMHNAIGYSATGETNEQCLFVLQGDGANGKSTFLNAVRSLLGSYAKHTPTDTLIAKTGGASNDLARLAGARFVTASEANADQKIADALLKQITGDEPITARFLFKEFISFQPQFKLFLATNQLPQINGSDPAMWRRIRTIAFTRVFTPEEQDRGLSGKLASESSGILAWIVRGAVKWYAEGLVTPSAVVQANAEYRAEMDSVGQFIEERCDQSADVKYSASGLYSNYRSHANDNGRAEINATLFGRTLTARGFPVVKHGGAKFRVGLTLRLTSNWGGGS